MPRHSNHVAAAAATDADGDANFRRSGALSLGDAVTQRIYSCPGRPRATRRLVTDAASPSLFVHHTTDGPVCHARIAIRRAD